MKNKKVTYFLIVAVVALWGAIIYQVILRVTDKDVNEPLPASKVVKEALNDYSIAGDSSKLLLNYRDPFGAAKQKDTASTDAGLRKIRGKIPASKAAINWSFITYSGFIRNPASRKLYALVSINGQNLTMIEGQTKNQVKLIKNLKDSIKISYNGNIKFITMKSSMQ